MTVCAVVILKDAIVAIADGRLTTGNQKSFDTAEKIIRIRPRYKLPIIVTDRLSHFEERHGNSWCIMYAGTYALCREVIETFRNSITALYLSRDYGREGAPYLSPDFDCGRNYMDDYNFRPDEIVAFHPSMVVGEFKDCLQKKGDEWAEQGKELDCEFILFGTRERSDGERANGHYVAYKITAVRASSGSALARVGAEPVRHGNAIAIGEPEAAAAIMSDDELQQQIASSAPHANPADSEFDQWITLADASQTKGVARRMVEIVRSLNHISIGGHLLLASARSGSSIELEAVAP